MSYKSILVTGADGFIGSHLVEKLVKKGFKVKAFVQYNFQNNWGWIDDIDEKIKNEVEVYQGDLRDQDTLQNASDNCDFIFNLAALIGIPYSYIAPRSYIETNLNGLINLMNIVKKKNNVSLVHTSTSEVYGTGKIIPMKENHPLKAQSPYAASKISADAMANAYFNSFKIPIAILRPFNNFGPRQSLRAIIPTIITQYLNQKNKYIKLGNLNVTRDFTFVIDTVEAFVATINNKKIIGETINIGSNSEVSVKEITKLISSLTNIKKKIIVEKKRVRSEKSEVKRLNCCNLKAKKLLNWSPKYSGKKNFFNSLEKTLEWYKKPNNLKKFKSEIYNI